MIRFEKWQGLGNDFVLVAGEDVAAVEALGVPAICDRRRGVGADGVVVVEVGADAEARMIVYNADGSRPEMCGNGLRCVVGWLALRKGLAGGEIEVLTDAGARRCSFERAGDGGFLVGADMGVAQVGENLDPGDGARLFTRVDVGNPHAVSFAPFEDADLDRLGPLIDGLEPRGSNVELCRLEAGRIEVSVWERGVGRTEACGTGACAAAVAACSAGRVPFDRPVEVALPGGVLTITVASADRRVHMRGPARRVFTGKLG
jgi:diaminopimelate epimerase